MSEPRELALREGGGFAVALLWEQAADRLFVRVVDEASGEWFDVDVEPAYALDAFHHPFAYGSPRRRLAGGGFSVKV